MGRKRNQGKARKAAKAKAKEEAAERRNNNNQVMANGPERPLTTAQIHAASGPQRSEDERRQKKIQKNHTEHHVDGPYYGSDYDPCID